MKKFVLIGLASISTGLFCFAEPVPQRDSSSADSPYYMDSQNILREKPQQSNEPAQEESSSNTQNQTDEPDAGNIEEMPPKQNETIQNEPVQDVNNSDIKQNNADSQSKIRQLPEDIQNDENNSSPEYIELKDNPINYDATEENIKDKNYTPPPKTEEPNNDKIQKPKLMKPRKEKRAKKDELQEDESGSEDNDAEENSQAEENEDNLTAQPAAPKTYSQDDYERMYREMPVPTFTFVHGVDPDQYYDIKDASWSPYPLFRLNAPLYFKTITIPPGYYLLTPRQYKGDWYILFKEAGVVKYTIPVIAKDYTAEFYYNDSLNELEMKHSQRWQLKFLNSWGKYVRKSKRKPAAKTNIELTDLDNNFLLIEFYYDAYKYTTIFKTEKF